MKTSTVLMLGGIGVLGYVVMKNQGTAATQQGNQRYYGASPIGYSYYGGYATGTGAGGGTASGYSGLIGRALGYLQNNPGNPNQLSNAAYNYASYGYGYSYSA